MRWEHYIRKWDHLLARLSRGVPELRWLLLADHRCSWLRHQTQLHPAAGSWAAWLHYRLVRYDWFHRPHTLSTIMMYPLSSQNLKWKGHLNTPWTLYFTYLQLCFLSPSPLQALLSTPLHTLLLLLQLHLKILFLYPPLLYHLRNLYFLCPSSLFIPRRVCVTQHLVF